jgi:maltooligosyltrehalose trehalohydrolase
VTPGARRSGDHCYFSCWAPACSAVDLVIYAEAAVAPRAGSAVDEKELPAGVTLVPMERLENGYFTVESRLPPGGRYGYRLNGDAVYPDPASRDQPEGVHGMSAVPDDSFPWTDRAFLPPELPELVLYELHPGTFTPGGTFDAAGQRLGELRDLGVTGVELMPVSPFPGERNWGYDGVYPWAVQSSYGGPDGLKRFVDAAHGAGLAVVLDVVFNHLGPEGNYSRQFGPYFTDRYQTPWGEALNFDGPGSDGVRAFFLGATRNWLEEYHLDGFRLDAVHEIHDESGEPFLREVSRVAQEISDRSGRRRIVIAESDMNDRRLVEPIERNGNGLDAAWADDFHHALHVTLTGETRGYYQDFSDPVHLARALEYGWSYAWAYSAARDRHHGTTPAGLSSSRFVFCTQNHDQVGNRMLGDRLTTLVGPKADRASRAVLLLAPAIPLLFMGQEYGERRPFLYFVDHSDQGLLAATREGRSREFEAFHDGSPPDPGSPQTHAQSILDWAQREEGDELALTQALLRLRRQFDCFGAQERSHRRAAVHKNGVLLLYSSGETGEGVVAVNLSPRSAVVDPIGFLSERARDGSIDRYAEVFRLGAVAWHDEQLQVQPYAAVALVSGYTEQECVLFQN